jgi:hypothetical protein
VCAGVADLGIHSSQLRGWKKKFADDPQHAFLRQRQMKAGQLNVRLKREASALKVRLKKGIILGDSLS